MNNKAQLLLVSGLLMSVTLIAVSSSITHSVNLGTHQGERHDLTPIISSIEHSFPLALKFEVSNAENGVSLSTSFDNVSDKFESQFILRGYSASFSLTSSSTDGGKTTFVYDYVISDGIITIELSKTTVL